MEILKESDFIYKIKKDDSMKTEVSIFANENILKQMKKDKTLNQIKNVASLKGVKKVVLMPDGHQGYGFPIGGVAAFDLEEGIISPGGVGYDINCSVRLLSVDLSKEEILKRKDELINELFKAVPSGVGKESNFNITKDDFLELISKGAKWVIEQGFGNKEDLNIEDFGSLKTNIDFVSNKAIKRGIKQIGTLGAGNHFLEIQEIDTIFQSKLLKYFDLDSNNKTTIMIHCGSRGFGHQIASDYIKLMADKYGFNNLPDKELVNAPFYSDLGQAYFNAMKAASNFAYANKQIITHNIRQVFNKIFGNVKINVIYEVSHNIAKIEKHKIDGEKKEVCVHRKGSTRSFGKKHSQYLPEKYKDIGQPVIIPGSMGTASYLLIGNDNSESISLSSTAHGAGRIKSRREAIMNFKGEKLEKDLRSKGIFIKANTFKGLAEEAPQAYKDIDEIIKISNKLNIANPIVRLKPIIVIKG